MVEKFLKLINLPQDKANHAFWLTFAYALLSIFIEPLYCLTTVVVVATAKELYDYLHKEIHTADNFDLIAGTAPSLVLYFATLVWSIV